MSEANKKPAARVTIYPVHATIWANLNKDGDTFYTTVFERRYRDRDGNWAGTQNFNTPDLLTLAKVADMAHSEIIRLRAADRKSPQQEEEPAGSEATEAA